MEGLLGGDPYKEPVTRAAFSHGAVSRTVSLRH